MERNPTLKTTVDQYTEGINQYIKSLTYKSLPLEYKLLDYTPENWTPLKCAYLLKSMAQTLNMGDKDMEMTNALTLFGKETVDLLFPDREPGTDAIVETPGGWNFEPIRLDSIAPALPDELISLQKLPGADPTTTGSNNWALSGSKTATGSPMLCGDPHLNLTLPSIWYTIQLNSPTVNTIGVSLPGSPSVIIGFNDSIAWSVTNAQRDLVDWFKITFQDSKKEKYKLDNEWVATKKVVEEFNVRGQAVFYDTVIYTHWGPVTYDESFRSDDELKHYAFRWIAHDGSEELMTFHKLNRAKNHNDYMDALDHYGSPAQNFVFASVSGDIAMRIQGKYPVRRKDEGRFVLDGSKRSNGWQAFIPNDQNVMYKNPERGFVSSANQYPADSTYPYYITATNFEAYRNRRINDVLRQLTNATVRDMIKLQGDNYNLKAAESLPLFLSMLDTTTLSSDEQEAYQILRRWNYFNNADAEGASYYEAWWLALRPLVWDEMSQDKSSLPFPTSYNTIKLIREKPELSFFDIQGTPEKETAQDVIRNSFSASVIEINKWKEKSGRTDIAWATYKDSYVGHLLRLEPFSIHVKHGGNGGIVNAHSRTHGPSWRMIVSLEKSGVKAWGTYPGGQSGNPGSLYYNNMLNQWTADQPFSLLFLQAPDQSLNVLYSATLNPVSK
jgi:penicillin amidase